MRFDLLTLLLEATAKELYDKYYSAVPWQSYETIVRADPGSVERRGEVVRVGKYVKALLTLYLKKRLKDSDVGKLGNLLVKYESNKRSLGDIGRYRSFEEIERESGRWSRRRGSVSRQGLGRGGATDG